MFFYLVSKKYEVHGLVEPLAGILKKICKFHALVGPPAGIFEENM